MGNILKKLQCTGVCTEAELQEIFVDFVNSQPTDEEKVTYDKAEKYLVESASILETLQTYKGDT